jgi:hypothetical protein
LGLSAASTKSVTFDEVVYLTGGYSYWTLNDYRLNTENGNLPQRLEALPLVAANLSFPSTSQPAWWHSELWEIGNQFFFARGNDVRAMVARGRSMVALLGAGLGVLVYCWSRRLFGARGALVSVILYSFCPTVLAHGVLATADMCVSFFFIASLWSVWASWHRLSIGSLLLSGLALGGVFLSKMSAFSVLPAGIVLLLVRLASNRSLELAWPFGQRIIRGRLARLGTLLAVTCVQGAIVSALIWAAFGFRFQAFRHAEPGRDTLPVPECWEQPGLAAECLRQARQHRLLPEGYLRGFAQIWLTTGERTAFFNGEFGTKGWLWYFPYCLAMKTPLPLFGILALAAAGLARSRRAGQLCLPTLLYEAAPLLVFFVVYWAFALTSHLNIGQRYLLPTYPVMFILAGAAALWLRPLAYVPSLLGAGLLLAFVAESLVTWPNYLSYFNAVAGGPKNGYRHLVDSSLDWGQDLPGLDNWLHDNGLNNQNTVPVYLSYFGTAAPEYYGVRAIPLPSNMDRPHGFYQLRGGVYCVSATMLQGVYLPHCPGPWTSEYETRYRTGAAVVEQLAATNNDPAARANFLRKTGIPDIGEFLAIFEEYRFGRLCARLRLRQPDDQIGYSILIDRLTDEEVARALSTD